MVEMKPGAFHVRLRKKVIANTIGATPHSKRCHLARQIDIDLSRIAFIELQAFEDKCQARSHKGVDRRGP